MIQVHFIWNGFPNQWSFVNLLRWIMVQFNLNHEKFILDYPIDRIIPHPANKSLNKFEINENQLLSIIIYCRCNYLCQSKRFSGEACDHKKYTITGRARSWENLFSVKAYGICNELNDHWALTIQSNFETLIYTKDQSSIALTLIVRLLGILHDSKNGCTILDRRS